MNEGPGVDTPGPSAYSTLPTCTGLGLQATPVPDGVPSYVFASVQRISPSTRTEVADSPRARAMPMDAS